MKVPALSRSFTPLFFLLVALLTATACASTPTQVIVVDETPPPPVPAEPQKLLEWTTDFSYPYLPPNSVTEQIITIDISGLAPKDQKRPPLHLALVVDHSGSMRGEAMEHARSAMLELLKQLDPEDTLSVIAFGSTAQVLLPQQRWSGVDQATLREQIKALESRGTTAMTPALQLAVAEVQRVARSEDINRVLLLSDGQPNDPSRLPSIAQNAGRMSIPVTTMGLGPHYDEELLTQLADLSGGHYRFIEHSDHIAAFFVDEMQLIQQTVARNAQVDVTFGPGVRVVGAFGAQPELRARGATFRLGALSASETRSITIELEVQTRAKGAPVELLDARLTWEDALLNQGQLARSVYIESTTTEDIGLIERSAKQSVLARLARLRAVSLMEEGLRLYEQGMREQATEQLNAAAELYDQNLSPAPPIEHSRDRSRSLPSRPTPRDVANQAARTKPSSDEGRNLIKGGKAAARSYRNGLD